MWESSIFIFIIITIIVNIIPSDTLESDRLNRCQEINLSPGLNRCEIYQPDSRGLMHSRPWLEGTGSCSAQRVVMRVGLGWRGRHWDSQVCTSSCGFGTGEASGIRHVCVYGTVFTEVHLAGV